MSTRSYRSVQMVDPDIVISAAWYLQREWGDNRRLGFAGKWTDSTGHVWHIFQCVASDGSRWLIRCDKYGNMGTFEPSLEREVADLLDVEVSG